MLSLRPGVAAALARAEAALDSGEDLKTIIARQRAEADREFNARCSTPEFLRTLAQNIHIDAADSLRLLDIAARLEELMFVDDSQLAR